MYPPARRSTHTDTYHGIPVPDPYRWMEDVDSPEVESWVTAQNTLTRSLLDPVPGRDHLRSRLYALTDFERVSAPIVRNHRFVYAHNSGLQNQAVLFWQQGLSGEPHLLLDPNTLSSDGTVALAGIALSDDGTHLAYALSDAGSDWVTWQVRQLAEPDASGVAGRDLPDRITHSKFSSASWLPDGSGFLYSGYGAPAWADPTVSGDPGSTANSLKDTQHFHKVYLHLLGTPQTDDLVVYERPDDGELLLGGYVTTDARYLLLTASKGHTNQLHARALDPELRPTGPLLAIAPVADARYEPVETDSDTLWLHTTSEAPNGRVVTLDLSQQIPAQPSPEGLSARDHWQTVLPETTHNLDSVSLVADTLIAAYLADAQSLVLLFSPTGAPLGPLTLPAIGTVSPFSGRRSDEETFTTFTNFTTPPTVLRLDLAGITASSGRDIRPELTPFRSPRLTFDPAAFLTTQVFFTSKDGTRVPMFLTHRRDLSLTGDNPTLLYAYGGFNISLLPAFSPSHLLWMELGGIFAQPNLRGGGEYGESWHQAGTGVRKQNVFDDFIAAGEYLIANRYTCPEKLAIEGGSNGGLLVAATELQRPELFGAAVAHVGVFDMLRFDQFTIGYAWKPDYGDPSGNEAEFHAIRRYSPLHNTHADVLYPPTLILTADHDDRVFPAHSFKFTAAMQHALSAGDSHRSSTEAATDSLAASPNPTLIRVEVRAGHGAGMPLSKRIDGTVDVYLFLARFLHLDLPV